ncbi:unnamed protein product, partial [Musa hybrid cultivar]
FLLSPPVKIHSSILPSLYLSLSLSLSGIPFPYFFLRSIFSCGSVYCGRGDKKTAKGKRFKHSLGNARPRDKTRGRGPRLPRRTASTTERSSRSKSMSPSSPSPREPCSSLV